MEEAKEALAKAELDYQIKLLEAMKDSGGDSASSAAKEAYDAWRTAQNKASEVASQLRSVNSAKAALSSAQAARDEAKQHLAILAGGEDKLSDIVNLKELLAQAIHNASSRAGGPFVTVDCASIQHEFREYDLFGYEPDAFPGMSREGNPGRFELANHGTIFLDNITAIPQEFQMQLLRIVESHRVTRVGGKEEIPLDIRIIVSTNHNIKQDVESRQFSSELFYRLNIFYLKIPPLRERRGDIAYCADYFVKRLNALYPNSPHLCSQEFLDGLERYEWPGNTRELQNSLERAFISSPEMTLSAESLRVAFAAGIESPVEQELRQGGSEAGVIRMVLTASDGDVEEAAKRLKMSRATLYRRLKKYNISPRTVRYN